MTKPAAKQGDTVIGMDMHIVLVPTPGGPFPTPTQMPFNGKLTGNLSPDVLIERKNAATEGSTADNAPAHVPIGGTAFQSPPSNRATVQRGAATVLINNKPAAHQGDPAVTCNDPADMPQGTVIGSGSVLIGG
jgi:uncharacterized Zn-binding protein involved in type VI secretion